MKKNYHILLKRTFYALIILFIIIPTFIVTFYGQMPGRIIGMIIFILIAILGIYEICSFMSKSKIKILTFALILIIGAFLLPFEPLKVLILNGNQGQNLILKGFIYYNFNWQTFVYPLFPIALFLLMDSNVWKKWKNCLILILMAYFTTFLVKGVWIINIFDWTKVIFILSVAAISDTSAYVGGMIFGKKWFKGAKLAPRISPSKTWAGSIIALIITVIFTTTISYFIHFWEGTYNELVLVIVGGFILACMAQLGDLLFSIFKRMLSTKDFSSLIPIHGGIFDRVDGMSLVVFSTILLFIFC